MACACSRIRSPRSTSSSLDWRRNSVPKVPYERDGAVGLVVLYDPRRNLLGAERTNALPAAPEEAEGDMPRVLVVRAEATVFTGGAGAQEETGLSPEPAPTRFAAPPRIDPELVARPTPPVASVPASS